MAEGLDISVGTVFHIKRHFAEEGLEEALLNIPLRVFIVDDHQMFREGIRNRLVQEPDIEVVGEASSGQETLAKLGVAAPTVVILDIRLPDIPGIKLATILRLQWPDLKILILSGYDFDQYVRAAARAGIHGYLLKDSPQDSVVQALRDIAVGGVVLPPRTASKAADELTLREMEILELIYQELTNNNIADRLALSPRTVETHVSHILSKLRAESRADAIRIAVEENLIR